MTQPSISTIKRLFALSGNRCAFPRCSVALVEGTTFVGEICHIRARSEGGPRFDPEQSDAERHGFENLLLLCPTHHKVIDDDDVAYTTERLCAMKLEHENTTGQVPEPTDSIAQAILVSSHNQRGGITANVVNINVSSSNPAGADRTYPARLLLGYTKERITQERHDYQLTVTIKNDGEAVLDDWHVGVEFPTLLLRPGLHYLAKVGTRSDARTSFFRFMASDAGRSLFPGDEKTFTIEYYVDHEIYWRHREVLDRFVVAKLYVGHRLVGEASKPVKGELEDF